MSTSPEKTLAGAGHEVMVIVVPAFAQREQRKKPVVLASVGGLVAHRAEQVRQRINRERVVPEQHGAEHKGPKEQRKPADQIQRNAQQRGRNEMILVEPAQL